MNRTILAAAILSALSACGGTNLGPGGLGGSNSCTVTLSGARTGTYDCHTAVAVWDSGKNQGGFTFSVSESAPAPGIAVAITFPGEPHAGTYAQTDAGAGGGATVSITGGASPSYWVASADPAGAQGSYSLKLTGVSNAYTTASGKAYNNTGTLDATLPAASGSGATGAVTLHATF